jgi:hypothetical protein
MVTFYRHMYGFEIPSNSRLESTIPEMYVCYFWWESCPQYPKCTCVIFGGKVVHNTQNVDFWWDSCPNEGKILSQNFSFLIRSQSTATSSKKYLSTY